jgi:hypothetical protein
MARHHDGNRIRGYGVSNRPGGSGPTYFSGDFFIEDCVAVGDLGKALPNGELKLGPLEVDIDGESLALSAKVLLHLKLQLAASVLVLLGG